MTAIRDTQYRWRYLLPASDRFFNRIFQDEDVPVDGDEDTSLPSLLDVTARRAEVTVTAEREPKPEGGAHDDPKRIRYCRILPACVRVRADGEAVIHVKLKTPVDIGSAERIHLWFFSDPEMARAGATLWLTTSAGDVLLKGPCSAERWTLLERDLRLPADARVTGLRLDIPTACIGTFFFDALRLGEPHGFIPVIEPSFHSGTVSVIPETVQVRGDAPLEIRYSLAEPLPAGATFELATPTFYMTQNRDPEAHYYTETFVRLAPDQPWTPLSNRCARKWDTRWRSVIAVQLNRPLRAGADIAFRISRFEWNAFNVLSESRSFRLYLTTVPADERRRFGENPVMRLRGSESPNLLFRRPNRRLKVGDLQPLFGYLHAHSDISEDGTQSPDACYRFGRDTARLDFCALTDHFWAREPLWKWEQIQQAAAKYNRDGEFATLVGYEWSSQDFGDRNVYFAGESGPPCPVEPIESTPDDLYAQLENERALIIPHSPAYERRARGIDWEYHHPRLERLVEVYSSHGSSEGLPGHSFPLFNGAMGHEYAPNSVCSALDRGYELGFLAGGDDHICPNPAGSGLAVVWAENRTRDAVFQALYERRCYGTTGPAIMVEYRMNEIWMGSVQRFRSAKEARRYRCRVTAPAPVSRIEWVKNGRVDRIFFPPDENANRLTLEWSDERTMKPREYAYCRGFTEDGHMFWTSPIWSVVCEGERTS